MIGAINSSKGRPLPVLADRFNELSAYQAPSHGTYMLLPFRFISLDRNRHVVTNMIGEYLILSREQIRDFVARKIEVHGNLYNELKSRHFLIDEESSVALDLLATKYRTKQSLLANFTSLFMFVTTLRCDHSCPYCQVSRQSENKEAFDMTAEMADRAIDFMFHSPAPSIKVEFQGGESLLNFELVKYIVDQVKHRNVTEGKDIAFVIATNLAMLTDDHLKFCLEHDIYLSTSLDGPKELHNRNRPRPGRDSYERTISGIQRAREVLGHDKVAALMTTTESSLSQPIEIVNEYVRQGFSSIFLRSISPYGFAIKTGQANRYSTTDWLNFYKMGLSHIIQLNQQGVEFREEYASIILRKMLTPWSTAYVDLQSPAGIGISCIVFNYDGDIYASDESRMLAEMNDKTFRLGNLFSDSFESVMCSPLLLKILKASMVEGVPMCSDCGLQPFCGSDPVYHYATQGDFVGHKPTSGFCQKNMEIMRHLIRLLEDDPQSASILRSWV
jgi:uncharacterized protein